MSDLGKPEMPEPIRLPEPKPQPVEVPDPEPVPA